MKKLKVVFVLIILALAGCLMAACEASGEQKLIDDGNVLVVFDCTGGTINDKENITAYIMPQSQLLKPGSHNSLPAPLRKGYYEDGWYKGTKNEDGTITYGDEWDFAKDYVPEEGITLYARWEESYYIRFLYGDGFSEEYIDYVDKIVKESDYSDLLSVSDSKDVVGYHFLEGYSDSAMTQKLAFPFVHPRTEKGFNIYVKTTTDNFTLVDSADDLKSITATSDYYLLNDINFEGKVWNAPVSYAGIFEGNGYTVKNIVIDIKQDKNNPYYGLFGHLNEATVRNVVFEKCSVSVDVGVAGSYGLYIGLLAGRIRNTAIIPSDGRPSMFVDCTLTVYSTSAAVGDPWQFVTAGGKLCGLDAGGNTFSGTAFNAAEFDADGIEYVDR